MKNWKRTLLVGSIVGLVFFGWLLRGFFLQNWNFNIFKIRDWAYIWTEFRSGWIIQYASNWIFFWVLVLAIPVFIYIWRVCLHVQWRKTVVVFVRKAFFYLKGGEKKMAKGKVKIKAKASHKKVRPQPMNRLGRPQTKKVGKTMDAHLEVSPSAQAPVDDLGVESASSDVSSALSEARPAFLNDDQTPLDDIALEDIQLPERVRLEENIAEILVKAGYQVVQDVHMGAVDLDYVAVSKERILLCRVDKEKGDWLADEEFFNGEEPLWFSETSHRTSPVYQLLQEAKALTERLSKQGLSQTVQPVLIEKAGVIINAEDMQKTFADLGVLVMRTDLGGPDELPSVTEAIPPASEKTDIDTFEAIHSLL